MTYKITAFIYRHSDFSVLYDSINFEKDSCVSRHRFRPFKSEEEAEQHFKEMQLHKDDLIEMLTDWGEENYCKSMRIAIADQKDQIVKVLAEASFHSEIFI